MRICRRLGASAMSAIVVAAVLAGPVDADTPESFAGEAKAHALRITLAGTEITVGGTEAQGDSSPLAQARGAGVALVAGTVSSAEVAGADQTDDPSKACVIDLPLNILNLSLACGDSRVSTSGGLPNALGEGSVATINLNGADLLQDLLDQLAPLVDSLIGAATQPLNDLLGPTLNPLLNGLGLSLDQPVQSLVDRLEQVTTILAIGVGESTSAITSSADAVVAAGEATGARIELLPNLLGSGIALATIIVGDAQAVSTFNRTSGESSASFDPAIARVKIGTLAEIPVGLGAPLELGGLLSVSLGAGRTVENEDGSVGAVADGVAISVLDNLLGIELAHAESAVGGRQAITSQQAFVAPVDRTPVQELARTGGDTTSWLPIGGFILLLAAFLTRRLVIASRRG